MNLANKITIFRLFIIPCFVAMVLLYNKSVVSGAEEVNYRIAALALFTIAGISDGLDGWIARRFNQQTALGQLLDPMADKFLLFSAIATLSVTHWHVTLPLWFGLLIISRDIMISTGCWYLKKRNGYVEMKAIMTSKICTVFQIACVCWVLLDFWSSKTPLGLTILIYITAALTVASWIQYVREGLRQIRECSPKANENRS